MTAVDTMTGEIVEALSVDQARRLTDRVRLLGESLADTLDRLAVLIDQARTGSAWLALGYRSWTEYASREFADVLPRLGREPRQELVRELASHGMSTRAIAPVVGASFKTIARDLEPPVSSDTPESPTPTIPLGEPVSRDVGVGQTPEGGVSPRAPRPPVTGVDGEVYTFPTRPAGPMRGPRPRGDRRPDRGSPRRAVPRLLTTSTKKGPDSRHPRKEPGPQPDEGSQMKTQQHQQDTVAKTTAIAMHAVAKHALDRRLPAPRAIRRPRLSERAVRVDLFVDEHEAWVLATGADYLSTTTIGEHRRSVSVRWTGRVPSPVGEVEVELRIVQRIADAPATLTLVPGGAA